MTDEEALKDYQRDMEDDDDCYFLKPPYLTKISANACRKRRKERKEDEYQAKLIASSKKWYQFWK